jgi:hypothetical protein
MEYSMSEAMQMWVEIGFNLSYLAAIWILVLLMRGRLASMPSSRQRLGRIFMWAFALLALGDTGHVGFRVLAYALGGLEAKAHVLGLDLGLVGVGAFSTAFTVTLFYMAFVLIWAERFQRPIGIFGWFLLAVGLARLVLMLFPQNEWNQVVAPLPWGWIRNAPLVIQGLGVTYLILRDAYSSNDRTFQWIGWMIITSFAFYAPVILFVSRIPVLGMLMIPKTLAYVAIAVIGWRDLFQAAPEMSPQV